MSKQLPTIRIQPDSQSSLPRRQSLDGRFTIIDEQSKDSDSFDETSSDNESNNDQIFFSKSGYISKCSSPNLPHLNYSTSQPSRMSALNANASRFRVVPVEAQYQRKRWIVWDWFDSGTQQNQNAMGGTIIRGSQSNPHTPNPVNSTKPIFHLTPPTKRSVQKSNSMRAPLATPDPPMSTTSLAFNFSDDSDRENSFPFEKNQITVRQTGRQPESEEPRTTNITDLRDELQSSRLSPTPSGILPSLMMPSGRISPSEMLNQYGLERSLSATSYSTPKSVTTTSQLKANSLSPDRATTHPYLNDGAIAENSLRNRQQSTKPTNPKKLTIRALNTTTSPEISFNFFQLVMAEGSASVSKMYFEPTKIKPIQSSNLSTKQANVPDYRAGSITEDDSHSAIMAGQ